MISVPTIASTQAISTPPSLIRDLLGLAVDQPERQHFAAGVLQAIVDSAGREHAGEQRAQRSARAVHAEGVQRVVVAELVS